MPPKYLRIGFYIQACKLGSWDDDPDVGFSFIRFSSYRGDMSILAKPNEIVIPMPSVRLSYTYPLNSEIILDAKAIKPEGFTRVELASVIVNHYKHIYAKQEQDPTFDKLVLNGLSHRVNNIFDVDVRARDPYDDVEDYER